MNLYQYIPTLEDITLDKLNLNETKMFKPIYETIDEKRGYISKYFCFETKEQLKILAEVYIEQCGHNFYLNFDFKLLSTNTWTKVCDDCYYWELSGELEYIESTFKNYFNQFLNETELERMNLTFTNYYAEKIQRIKNMTPKQLKSSKKALNRHLKNEGKIVEKVLSVVKDVQEKEEKQLNELSENLLKETKIKFLKEKIEESLQEKDKESFLKYSNALNEELKHNNGN